MRRASFVRRMPLRLCFAVTIAFTVQGALDVSSQTAADGGMSKFIRMRSPAGLEMAVSDAPEGQRPEQSHGTSEEGEDGQEIIHFILPGSPEMEALERLHQTEAEALTPTKGHVMQRRSSGTLSICAVPNPTSWYDTESEFARWLDLTFNAPEWDAIISGVIEGNNLEDSPDALATAGYPMLGRIRSMYEATIYKREEVARLHAECLDLQGKTHNALALEGLQTLIQACDEASNHEMGLYMASD